MKVYRGENLTAEVNRRKNKYLSQVVKEVRKNQAIDFNEAAISLQERDFVDEVRKQYFEDDSDTILVISGLRSTGKTFGLLQAVENHLDNALYITADYNENDKTAKDYIEVLNASTEKYVIIDEYSWIKDREELDKSLYSYVNHPNPEDRKRIVITGTDSIAMDSLSRGGLIHRAIYKSVNFFSYQEFCRLYYKQYSEETCLEYIEKGGIFLEDAIEDYNDMQNYIQFAVIDNLANSINIDKQTAKAIVYEIIYQAVCPSDENKVRLPKSNNVRYQNMLRRIGIDPNTRFAPADLRIVGDLLVKTGFVVKTYNYADVKAGKFSDDCRFRYNLTNPSVAYQMLKNFFDNISAQRRLGIVFEASVVSYMYYNLIDQDEMYYIDLQDNAMLGNPELEIVVVNRETQQVFLMDSKKESVSRLAYNQSIISEDLEKFFGCYSVAGRYVICNISKETVEEKNGKKVIFTNIESDILKNYDFFEDNCKILKEEKRSPRKDRYASDPTFPAI